MNRQGIYLALFENKQLERFCPEVDRWVPVSETFVLNKLIDDYDKKKSSCTFRIADKVRVPQSLTPDDVRPGTIWKGKDWGGGWGLVVAVIPGGMTLWVGGNSEASFAPFHECLPGGQWDHVLLSEDKGATWKPAYREA